MVQSIKSKIQKYSVGTKAKILLVGTLLALLISSGAFFYRGYFFAKTLSNISQKEYSDFHQAHEFQIEAAHFQQFWRWPSAQLPQDLQIEQLYFLQASWHQPGVWIEHQHYATKLRNINQCFLVYRLETLADANQLMPKIKSDFARWESQDNHISGIQFDFDSGTESLMNYVHFLKTAKQLLPRNKKLSVTGLMDWGNSTSDNLEALKDSVDEVIFQTYQGRNTLPNLKNYFEKILSKDVEFKLGLIANGRVKPDDFSDILKSHRFKGFVVFVY